MLPTLCLPVYATPAAAAAAADCALSIPGILESSNPPHVRVLRHPRLTRKLKDFDKPPALAPANRQTVDERVSVTFISYHEQLRTACLSVCLPSIYPFIDYTVLPYHSTTSLTGHHSGFLHQSLPRIARTSFSSVLSLLLATGNSSGTWGARISRLFGLVFLQTATCFGPLVPAVLAF